MPYGAGRRLGDTVRPELGAYDYSGVAQAGHSLGQGFADIGQGLRVRSNEKKQIEKSLKLAKDIGELIPELQPQAQEAIQMMIDPNRSHRDQLAIAEGIKDTLNLGLMMKDDQYKQRALDLEAMRAMASMRGDGEPYSILSPQEMDAYTQAGYQMPEVYRLPDGNFQVKMARKPPSPGGMSIVAGPDGGMQFVPTGGSSFGKTPGYEAMGLPSSVPPNEGGFAPLDGGVLPLRNDSNAPPPDIAPWAVDPYGFPVQQTQPASQPSPLAQAFGGFGGKVPGEILRVDAQGRPIGATRIPGSLSEQTYNRNEQAMQRDVSEAELARAKAAAEQQKMQEAGTKKEKAEAAKLRGANLAVQELNRAINLQRENFQGGGIGGGIARAAMGKVPGSTTSQVQSLVGTVQAITSIEKLQEMRANSPTGGALGSVTEKENKMLADTLGALDPSLPPAQFNANAKRAISLYLDAAHGTAEQRAKLVAEGKISPFVNAQIEAQYPSTEMNLQGQEVPRQSTTAPGSSLSPDTLQLIESLKTKKR